LFSHPGILQYDYWFRLDCDVSITENVTVDYFSVMQRKNYLYACPEIVTLYDLPDYAGRLPDFLHNYFLTRKQRVAANTSDPFYWTTSTSCDKYSQLERELNLCNRFNLRCCNSHFELGSFKFFRSNQSIKGSITSYTHPIHQKS